MIEQVKTRKRNWHTKYRLVLRKDETLEEVGSYRLTLLNIYILLSSIVILAMSLMAVVIFFTPLKHLVPGYGEPSQHPDYIKLTKKMATLESELESYKLYYENFNKLISLSDSSAARSTNYTSKIKPAKKEPEILSTPVSSDAPMKIEPPVNTSPKSAMLNPADYRFLMPPISGVVSSYFDPEKDH